MSGSDSTCLLSWWFVHAPGFSDITTLLFEFVHAGDYIDGLPRILLGLSWMYTTLKTSTDLAQYLLVLGRRSSLDLQVLNLLRPPDTECLRISRFFCRAWCVNSTLNLISSPETACKHAASTTIRLGHEAGWSNQSTYPHDDMYSSVGAR